MVEFIQTMSRVALILLSTRLLFGQTPQSPQDLLKEAVTFQEQGKLAEAIRDYDLFLDMYPDAAEVRSNLGAALAAGNQYARAIEEYKLALLKKPDPQVRLNLALAYYKTTAYRDAAKELDTVNAADPGNIRIVAQLDGRVLELILGEDNLENLNSGSQLGHKFIFDLTRRLGGMLSVVSEEEKGTKVSLLLPGG